MDKFREIPKLHEFTMNEIRTLAKIDNPNCVKFQEMLKTSNNMYLIYEYCNGGTLEQAIHRKKFLSEGETIKIFSQLLNAFKAMIKENILHRDLKPSNILFHNNVIKIADFGFCKSLMNSQDMTSTMVGSPIYMAPEVLKGMPYNTKADVWSMGVVFFECLFGYCPYEDQSIAKLITQIDNTELQIPRYINQISKKAEDLIRAMLVVDFRKRIDWPQLFALTEEKFHIQIGSTFLTTTYLNSNLASQPLQLQNGTQASQQNQQQHFQQQQQQQPLLMKKHSSSNLGVNTSPNSQQPPNLNSLNGIGIGQNNSNIMLGSLNNNLGVSTNNTNNFGLGNSLGSNAQIQGLGLSTNNNANLLGFNSNNNFQGVSNNNNNVSSTNNLGSSNNLNFLPSKNNNNNQGQGTTYLNYSNNFNSNPTSSLSGVGTGLVNGISPLSANKDILNVLSPSNNSNTNNMLNHFSSAINSLPQNSNNGGNSNANYLNSTPYSNNQNQQNSAVQNGNLNQNFLIPSNNISNNGNVNTMNNTLGSGSSQEEKTKMSMNMRILVRERNKINFLSNVLGTLLEFNYSVKTPVVAFLIMKYINIYTDQLKLTVNTLKSTNLSKRMEKIEAFENSNEFKKFKGILTREIHLISNIVDLFKVEILRLIKTSPHYQDNQMLKNEINNIQQVDNSFFQTNIYNYVDEIFSKAKELHLQLQQMSTTSPQYMALTNETRQVLLHVNEMLDSFMIEEFFENFIDVNSKYTEQKYFENIRKYKPDSLQELVAHKFDYVRSKLNPVNS
ncbi:hypothetical protein ABPG73_020520 [Tetrahymena malaccensis]